MPPRPALKVKQNRPISAIYLGKDASPHALQPTSSSSSYTEGTPPELPDLPEPPSPSSSTGSVQTGLPSPPATNSTGSGSTGDPATIAIRERPLSHHSNSSTSSGTASTPMKPSLNGSETGFEDNDYDRENDNDNDNDNDSNDDTARLNGNVMALQRVKNLAERNRIVLSKLSRISSPSPHRPSPSRSGSETERENEILSHSSSSSHHPSPSLSSISLSHDSSRRHRTSASVSSSSSSHSRRRKRASMASMSTIQRTDFEEEEDNDGLETATGTARNRTRDKTLSERDLITQSALAAVASSRRSPLNSRRRTALPKEFRSDVVDSPSPAAPNIGRKGVADPPRASVDADVGKTPWKPPTEPVTPFRSTRPSTVRDYRRSGGPNPRWSVDDFRSPSTIRQYNTSHSNNDGNPKRERRQTLRGGSAESALLSPGGRSLIGEGLRAAGLSKKREEDRKVDLSPEDKERSVLPERDRRNPPRAATSMANYRYMDKEDDPDPRYRDADRPPRQSPSRNRESLLAREASTARKERERDAMPMDRSGSSFTRYNHSASPVPLLATPQHMRERLLTASPFSTRRLNVQTPGGASSSNQTEHLKLMLESLTMLETQLNKIPPGKSLGGSSNGMGMGTGALQTELTKNAQSMVYAAERLSGSLKQGSGKAVEEQVEAEVEGSSTAQEISNIWGRVAAEYRENSRVADELVRGMTGFLLGIGRIIRDIGPSSSLADFPGGGSPSAHGKHASLDADEERMRLRRDGFSPDLGSAGSGRRSASSRNSRDPGERDRMAVSSGSGNGGQRPESVLARSSPATYQKLRSADRGLQFGTPPPPPQKQQHSGQASIRRSLPALGDRTESTRKLFTPREQREQMLDAKFSSGRPVGSGIPTRDSQETVQPLRQSHEPSPTPASRTRGGDTQERERVRILPPLNIPKPLPILPSETLVKRQSVIIAPTSTTPATTRDRRSTIRSSLPAIPSLTTPSNATTAVTPHTVSNSNSYSNSHISAHTNSSGSGSTSVFSLHRTNSSRSDRSQVTFSRPLESASVSVSAALTGLQMQFRSGAGDSSADERDREGTRDGGKEREREKSRTIGNMRSARMSLDELAEQSTRDKEYASSPAGAGAVDFGSNTDAGASSISGGGGSQKLWDSHAADRSAASTFLQQHPGPVNQRRRRRTATDIWPN